MAASIFEQNGIITTHVDVYGSDLWCKTPSGRMVSVQVKTTLRLGAEGEKQFRLFSAAEMPKSTTKRVSQKQMTEELMLEDLKRYLY